MRLWHAQAPPALDILFLAHSIATVVLLGLPGVLSLLADKVSTPLENVVFSVRDGLGKTMDPNERSMIIDLYERILKSDRSLKDILSEFDQDGDGTVSCWECKRAFSRLNLPQTQCETLMRLMQARIGRKDKLEIESWLDVFQQVYVDACQPEEGNPLKMVHRPIQLETTKTFVEIFNDMDKDNDGFVTEQEFNSLLDKKKIQLTDKEKHDLFQSSDVLGQGHLNLFEFMSMMRKIVEVGIQEIGYGYLPLAWASLTAYWMGIGMKELGLSLARLPDTFYLAQFPNLPHIAASNEAVAVVQTALMLASLPVSIGLTQKLCNDNKIGGIRFGLHAAIQTIGVWATLYLLLSSNPGVA